MIRVSEAVVKALQAEGIDTVFGYPGAAICPVFDSLIGSGIRSVLVRQEQNAGHAASGWARLNGKPGVCIVTSGPGATNLLTALATAYMDSIPLVAITGQVPCDQIGKDVFQEADITGAAEPFTKHSYLVKDAKIIPEVLKNAFYIASTGRPGPVLVDIPLDIQRQEIEFDYPQRVQIRGYKPPLRGHAGQIGRVASALRNAKRPLLCAGGGVILSGAQEALRLFCEQAGVPVVTTLMGLGALPAGHPLHLGMLGVHGSRRANQALHRCDLLIILGARISDRAIAATGQIAPGAQIVHIDIDTAEIGKNIGATIPLVGDARLVLQDLLEKKPAAQSQAWLQELLAQQEPEPSRTEPDGDFVNPHAFLRALSDRMQPDAVVCADVGQNQIWTASGLQLREGRLLTSGGMGDHGLFSSGGAGRKAGPAAAAGDRDLRRRRLSDAEYGAGDPAPE